MCLFGLWTCVMDAQWVQTNGPYGGRPTAITVSEQTVLVGTNDGVVFVTTNNGDIWKPLNQGTTHGQIRGLHVIGDQLIVVGQGQVHVCSMTASDSGLVLLPFMNVGAVGVVGTDVFLVADSVLYRSSDSLTTWEQVSEHRSYSNVSTFCGDSTFIYFGSYSGRVYCSDDRGLTWTDSSVGLPDSTISKLIVVDNRLFALISGAGIYASSDRGLTWVRHNAGLPSRFTYDMADVDGVLYTLSSEGGVFTSRDGQPWVSQYPTHETICRNIIATNTHVMLVADTGMYRVLKSDSTWEVCNHGITTCPITNIVAYRSRMFFGTSGKYIQSTTDEGMQWQEHRATTSSFINDMLVVDTILLASTDRGMHTLNNDDDWEVVQTQDPYGPITAVAATSDTIIASAYALGLIRSTDNAHTWSLIAQGIDDFRYGATDIEMQQNFAYILPRRGKLYRSQDYGASWDSVALPGGARNVTDLELTADGVFIAIPNVGVYFSTDGGRTWQPRSVGLESRFVHVIEYIERVLYVGTSDGVMYSHDLGLTWHPLLTGITTSKVTAIGHSDALLYVGTQAGSIFKGPRQQAPTNVHLHEEEQAGSSIDDVAPLPLTNEASIVYTIRHPGLVMIRLVDFVGRTAFSVVNTLQDVGTYRVSLDTSTLSAGRYILQLYNNHCIVNMPLSVVR